MSDRAQIHFSSDNAIFSPGAEQKPRRREVAKKNAKVPLIANQPGLLAFNFAFAFAPLRLRGFFAASAIVVYRSIFGAE